MLRWHATRAEHYHLSAKVIITCTEYGDKRDRERQKQARVSDSCLLVAFYCTEIHLDLMAHLPLPLFDAWQCHRIYHPMSGVG